MDDYTADEIYEARAPLASLLSKSEKAQQKIAPGSWQHTMLQANIQALRVAIQLVGGVDDNAPQPTRDDLSSALRTLDAIIEKVEETEVKFSPGTSQHSLQRNRLRSLRIARATVAAKLGEG